MLLLEVLWGRFRPGLAAIVRDRTSRHFRRNVELRKHRYPRLKQLAFWITKRPLLSIAVVAAAYAVGLAVAAAGAPLGFWAPDPPDAPTPAMINGHVLGAQATLVGLVFPLVIAFVGLLNQGRASFASRLTIYLEDSAAVFVGVSSLLLCAAVAIQLRLDAQLAGIAGMTTSSINVVWLAVNTAALAYFVLRTIAFLHPARRSAIFKAYVANVAWRKELIGLVTENRWGGAGHYGYLPKGDAVDWQNKSRASVWYSSIWGGGDALATRTLRRSMRLTDVRFAMLRPIIEVWLSKARAAAGEEKHNLILPLRPGSDYAGSTVIARATLPVDALSRWGIRASFAFSRCRSDPTEIRETARVLKEMIADLITLIDERRVDEFTTQVRMVSDFHSFMLMIAQAVDEDFNYAQLGSGWGSQAQEWVSQYTDTQRRAVEQLSREAGFFGGCCYVAPAIFEQCRKQVAPAALKPLLLLSNWLFYRLLDWAEAEHVAEAASMTVRPYNLRRHVDAHDRAWREYVGAWERLLSVIVDGRNDGEQTWQTIKRTSLNLFEHLRLTAEMVGRAAWVGDDLATSWSADLLLHWRALAVRDWDSSGHYHYLLHGEGITLDLLAKEWGEIDTSQFQAVSSVEVSPTNLFAGIVHNAARDHLVAIACICIHWANDRTLRDPTARAARMLLANEYHDLGDTGVTDESAPSTAGVLVSLLRIAGARGEHRAAVSGLAEALSEFRRTEFVSGRMYSGGGGLGFSGLHSSHALAMMARASQSQGIDDRLRRLATQASDEVLRAREDYLVALLNAFDRVTSASHAELLSILIKDGAEDAFNTRHQRARELVAAVLAELQGRRAVAIVDAEIDPDRLHAVALAASKDAFEPKVFPLHLFGELARAKTQLKEFTLRIGGVSKGVYTTPRMAQAAVNEDDWWQNVMQRQVASIVWDDAFREIAAKAQPLEGKAPETFWSAIRDSSAQMRAAGLQPILVVGNRVEPSWLSDWRWTHRAGVARPSDLTITRETGRGEGYQFSMNDIPVFSAATFAGEALLFARSQLRRATFHEYENGLPVTVSFEGDPNDAWSGSLSAEFQRQVEVDDVAAFRIAFADTSGEGEEAEEE